LRVFIVHGRQDQSVNFERALEARDILRRHGYDVALSAFSGGHVFPAGALQAAVEWLRR
jgi:predicted esterase